MNAPSKQTLPAVVECDSPGCQWLQQYLRSIPRKVEPCQDFYSHACDGVDVDLMTRGVVKFMQATGDVILRSAAHYEEGLHASVFNNCMQARDIMPRDLWRIKDDEPCTLASKVPWYAAPFLKEGGNVSDDLLWMLIHSLSPGLRDALNRPPTDLPRQLHMAGTGWMYSAARRVKHVAQCHVGASGEAQSGEFSYSALWILFYFTPFLGEEVCLRILEDNFRTATEKAASAVLTDMFDDPRGTVGHVVWEVKQASRNMMATLLGQSVVRRVDG
ncbi:uncharacterized protein LOC135376805 [Ornithodoros turicata]|uniref:uncharacterized protein LOC135376805 n=1 Tax=Ornithodoros turicata TaxID=34597 RepID=UPI003138D1A5